MDHSRADHFDDDTRDAPPMPTQAELEAMFDADDIDVAAGRVIPAELVFAELRALAARSRLERAEREATAPPRG